MKTNMNEFVYWLLRKTTVLCIFQTPAYKYCDIKGKNNIPPLYFVCRVYNDAAVANVAAVTVVNAVAIAVVNVAAVEVVNVAAVALIKVAELTDY